MKELHRLFCLNHSVVAVWEYAIQYGCALRIAPIRMGRERVIPLLLLANATSVKLCALTARTRRSLQFLYFLCNPDL